MKLINAIIQFIMGKKPENEEGVKKATPVKKPASTVINSPTTQLSTPVITEVAPVVEAKKQEGMSADVSKFVKPTKSNNDEARKTIATMANAIASIVNQPMQVSALQVIEMVRHINPNVVVVAQHPAPDVKQQSCFLLSYKGESLRVPETGHFSTKF